MKNCKDFVCVFEEGNWEEWSAVRDINMVSIDHLGFGVR